MVTFADKSREAELTEIWQRSFGDSAEYIRMFLEWNAAKSRIVVYEAAGKAVSVAYLLPIVYSEPGQADRPYLYLYAAATLPEYRGRGYFGEIMSFIEKQIPEPVLLVPGETSLIDYYEKLGLRLWLKESRLEIQLWNPEATGREVWKDKALQYEVSDLDFKAYKVLRDKLLADTGFMKWDEHFIEYICHENAVCGGTQKYIRTGQAEYIALYRTEGRKLRVLELLPHTEEEACLQILLKETGCESAELCLQPNVMKTKFLPDRDCVGYFNLTMG